MLSTTHLGWAGGGGLLCLSIDVKKISSIHTQVKVKVSYLKITLIKLKVTCMNMNKSLKAADF